MNLVNDVLKLKCELKHDQEIVFVGMFQDISIMLYDICKLKEEVKKLNKRLDELEKK